MKSSPRLTRLPRLVLLALASACAMPVLPLRAAETSTSARPGDKFKITYSRLQPPETEIIYEQLKAAQERYKSGTGPKEAISQLEFQFSRMMGDRQHLLTVHSEGGTLRELLAALAAGKETSLTLINAGEPADLDLVLPAFDLRNATWHTLIEVISNFVATRGLLLKIAGSDRDNPNSSSSLTCVMRRASGPDGRQAGEAGFEAIQLTGYLDREQTVEKITEAIRAGWELFPGVTQDALRLKYHPETKLLLVSGPAPAVQVARQVIGGLQKKKPVNP